MSSISLLKFDVMGLVGILGAGLATLFGGWGGAMTALVLFMAVDYLSGFICAGVFKKSNKSKNGALESKAGFKGLCRKGMIFLIVLVAAQLDAVSGINYLKDLTVIAFIVNETVSITENAGLMGVPMPKFLLQAIELLKNKVPK